MKKFSMRVGVLALTASIFALIISVAISTAATSPPAAAPSAAEASSAAAASPAAVTYPSSSPATSPSSGSSTVTPDSNECTLYPAWINLKYSGNSVYAQGLTGQDCVPPTSSQYACGRLDEFWLNDNSWHQMNYTCGPSQPANSWSWAYPERLCTGSATREWRLRADGSAVIRGTIYGSSTAWIYKYLSCVA